MSHREIVLHDVAAVVVVFGFSFHSPVFWGEMFVAFGFNNKSKVPLSTCTYIQKTIPSKHHLSTEPTNIDRPRLSYDVKPTYTRRQQQRASGVYMNGRYKSI